MKQQTQTAAAESGMTAKKTQHQKIVAMVQIALFAAIIAVCSWIQIPMTVPFTMQTFAVFCALATLGGKGGTISILIYIVLGAVGVPVFAGFTGGIGILFGTTGGYNYRFPVHRSALLADHPLFRGEAAGNNSGTGAGAGGVLRLWYCVVHDRIRQEFRFCGTADCTGLVRIPVHSAGLRKNGSGNPDWKAAPEAADPACINYGHTTACARRFSAGTATAKRLPQT